jgi:lysozyme
MRELSPRGEKLIKDFEQLRLVAYRDQAGILTNGWGHTGNDVYSGQRATLAQAQEWFDNDIEEAVATVSAIDTRRASPLTPLQFDALVSFEFNTGALSSQKNRVTQHVAACRDDLVDDEMLRWAKVTDPATGKKVLSSGLKRRRNSEASLWLEGCASGVGKTWPEFEAASEATTAPAAPSTPAAQAATSPAVHGSAIAAASTALSTATEQIEPLAAYSDTLRVVFVVLAVAGVCLAVWGAVCRGGAR